MCDTNKTVEVNDMANPKWLTEAYSHIGLKEIAGVKTAKEIEEWLKELGAWWKDDETAWCGTFVAICLKRGMRTYPKHWYRALAYRDYGTVLDKPCVGCIVSFTRSGGGHVGFVVGKDKYGNLMVLGGNQKNMVNIMPFSIARDQVYIWPANEFGVKMLPLQSRYTLPVIDSNGKVSTNEA